MKLTKSKLKEIIREELLNEGPANEYAKTIKAIDKHYTEYWHSINDLAELLEDKGFKKDATQLQKEFKKKVARFQDRWLPAFMSLLKKY
jgi:N-acetyl-anhydromuramyl-L-alanine amidase AmpD